MNKLTLTVAEIIALKQAHRACKDKRAADRIKAIYSLGTGFSVEDVVKILMLDDETLRNYVKRYQTGGINALITDHYMGSFSKLSAVQLLELNAHLEQNTYLTVEAIIAYVDEAYDVLYSLSGMTDLLHRLKFTYKKSKLVPAKADKDKQEQFLKQLDELRKDKSANDPILYMDGVHPQHNTMLAYGWIKKGQDNIIKSNTGRQRININGALDADTHAVITREDESINAISTIALLEQVEAAYPLAAIIYVICDNARYYRSKLVGKFLETSKIQLMFLPSYSPNLNLIERLWKFMKKQVLYNKYYEKFDTFKQTTLGFFENIQQYKTELDSLLTNNFHLLNAN
ncbi:MAG: IS630 family transposase [Legionella sp.]|nr:MAG: IS630 family transposase [Legionella sp.]